MGNHCVCVQTDDSPVANSGAKELDGLGKAAKPVQRGNAKCCQSIIRDLNTGHETIPSVSGESWQYRPGCSKASGLLSDSDIERIAIRMSSDHRLKRLELISRGFGNPGAEALAMAIKSPACSSLTYLSLSHNNITDEGFCTITEALQESSILKTLKIDGNALGGESLASLGECLTTNRGLEVVEICIGTASVPIKGHHVRQLGSGLASNATLKSIKVSGELSRSRKGDAIQTIIEPKDMGELFAKLTENKTLSEVTLSYLVGSDAEPVRTAFAQCAAYILQATSLKTLDLTGNIMGDTGGVALATALASKSSLTYLNLSRNRLTGTTLEKLGASLAANSSLLKLDLSYQYHLYSASLHERPKAPQIKKGFLTFTKLASKNTCLESLNLTDFPLDKDTADAVLGFLRQVQTVTELRHSEVDVKAGGYALQFGQQLQENQESEAACAAARMVAIQRSASSHTHHSTQPTDEEHDPSTRGSKASIPELAWRPDTANTDDQNYSHSRSASHDSADNNGSSCPNNDVVLETQPPDASDFVEVAFGDEDCYQ